MEDKTIITVVAICGVVILEGIALALGINGQLLATTLAILAGAAGVTGGYKLGQRTVE